MNRGELWTVAGGVYAAKPRPALIIQDDRFDATASVIVLPLTSTITDTPLLRIDVASTDVSGLRQPSQVMIDKVTAIRRVNVQDHLGRVTASQLVEVERAMLAFLGLAG